MKSDNGVNTFKKMFKSLKHLSNKIEYFIDRYSLYETTTYNTLTITKNTFLKQMGLII